MATKEDVVSYIEVFECDIRSDRCDGNRGSGSVLTKYNEPPAQPDRFPAILTTIFGSARFWKSSIPENSISGFV
jgi:hypothetical protein